MKEPLSVVFPSLFALTANKEALVATCGSLQGRRGWFSCFYRSLFQ